MRSKKRMAMVLFGMFVLAAPSLRAQKIVAHRGASHLAPENTLAAVALAYELGADAAEIDIHLTQDNQIVVMHDHSSARTSGTDFIVKETSLAALRKLEVGSWKDEKFRGEKIPLLAEILGLVPEGKTLVVELKTGSEILPALKREIENSGISDRLELISFNREAIVAAKQLFPEIPAYWLLHNFSSVSQDQAIQIAKENNLQGLDVHYSLVTPEFMKAMTDAGLRVYVYTVNDVETGKALKAARVHAITTDVPRQMLEELRK